MNWLLPPKMELIDEIAISFYAAASGAAALCAFQAMVREHRWHASQSVLAFTSLLSANSLLNLMWLVWPSPPLWLQSLSAVALAGLAPFMWLYVDDITSPTVRTWKRTDLWKLWTIGLALILVVFAACLPPKAVDELTGKAQSASAISYAYFGFGLFVQVCILLQSSFYVWKIIKRLGGLAVPLQQLYSNARERQPNWLWSVVGLLVLSWFVTLVYNLGLVAVPEYVFGILAFTFTISFCVWSTFQKPTFEEADGTRTIYPDFDELADQKASASIKYERSLLPEDRLDRIASKIAHAFVVDALHLNPVLSLRKLAKHLAVPEQHLSQTFTRQLKTSFYDYVNSFRIEMAKTQLKETDDLIVDIAFAVGYNSRSAFYNAFKSITGQTPSEFREIEKVH